MKKRLVALFITTVLALSLFSSISVLETDAAGDSVDSIDPMIIVSLGDSYSSGEGIEPFYSQSKSLEEKILDPYGGWVAHRSELSWPSLIEIPGISGTMHDYNVDYLGGTSICKWYFRASSGATTNDFRNEQKKRIYKKTWTKTYSYNVWLWKQLKVFDDVTEDVDYVTLTVGGNDVDFVGVIKECAMSSTYLGTSTLFDKLKKTIQDFSGTREKIKQTYDDIRAKAGPQAKILVAGYPKLLSTGSHILSGITQHFKIADLEIDGGEVALVNAAVSWFNNQIEEIVNSCDDNFYFVDVEDEFDGHEAYTSDAWINSIIVTKKSEDLEDDAQASSYSVHPNKKGAQAYAKCMNAKISEIEKCGTLSGKICKASDRNSSIGGANINVFKGGYLYRTCKADNDGAYSISLDPGKYYLKISANGYVDFGAYATVISQTNTYMETFLLIQGFAGQKGVAKGTVFNSLTGEGTPEVELTVYKDWNNIEETDEKIAETTTNSNGYYSFNNLPIGNYTVVASKPGFVKNSFNIISQNGLVTDNQNGTITPIVDGDEYLITLTWGENPRDLDSHVVGTLSNDREFHVFYNHKSQYDGDIEVCNLDYDDTTSYGPEHITLKPTTSKPYYYYIYRYAGSGTVASSSAKITVHKGNQLIASYNVPTNLGSDDYWNVFAIKNGQIINKNSITSSADTNYAN